MKRIIFFITLFVAIYLASCITLPPTFEEKATSTGIAIIQGNKDEKGPVMQELLSKCSPAGRIEALTGKQQGDYVINRALELGANTVHIYYIYYGKEESDTNYDSQQLYYMTRFWICKDFVENQKNHKN